MSKYVLTIVFGILGLILGLSNKIVKIEDKKEKNIRVILLVISFIIAIGNLLVQTDVPEPEFYMTNGDNDSDNKGYFQVEYPFSTYYTLEPYGDPKETGIKYKKPFKVEKSCSVRYAAGIKGIVWGTVKSEDIVLKSNGQLDVIATDEPGRSIAEITAYLKGNNILPGDKLDKKDFIVKGKTIAGDTVTIDEFKISPTKVVEGENKVVIDYKGLESQVDIWTHTPQIMSIKAEYKGEDIVTGTKIPKDDIKVTATYDDGHVEKINDFELNPAVVTVEGENNIKVLYEKFSDNLVINVLGNKKAIEKEALFNNCYEKDIDVGAMDQVGFGKWESEKKDVQGNTYEGNQPYITMGNLFNQIQDAGDSYIDAAVVYIVNPDYDLSEGVHVKEKFVVIDQYLGSDAYTDISIKIDGKEVWSTDASISGNTVSPVPFEFELGQRDESMTMEFQCNALGAGLGLGIIFEEIK